MRTLVMGLVMAALAACGGSKGTSEGGKTASVCASASNCEKACNGSEFPACTHLATMKLLPRGTDKDVDGAVVLLDKACEGGHARACSNLGTLFMIGNIVPEDTKRGRLALRRACELGDGQVCSSLVSLDSITAGTALFGKSAQGFSELCEADNVHGCAFLASELKRNGRGTKEEREEAARKAGEHSIALARAQCERSIPQACSQLGHMLLFWKNDAWELDPTKGLQLIERACDLGYAEACQSAAFHVSSGEYGPADLDKAKRLAEHTCFALDNISGCAELFSKAYPWQRTP